MSPQQIDEMLVGSLSQEDEDAVLAELEAITQVGLITASTRAELVHVDDISGSEDPKQLCSSIFSSSCVVSVLSSFKLSLRETLSFPRFPQTSCQKSQRTWRRNQVRSLTCFFFILDV